jgi:hypothetical protein
VSKPYLQRFFKKLLLEMGGFLSGQQIFSALVLAVCAAAYQYRAGKMTLEALKDNIAAVIYPFLWVVCGFGCFYVIKAAIDLRKEAIAEAMAYKPTVQGFSPKPPSVVPGIATAASCIALLGLLSYGTFILAFPKKIIVGDQQPLPPGKIANPATPAPAMPVPRRSKPTTHETNSARQTALPFGNLKKQTEDLANKMMNELYQAGWKEGNPDHPPPSGGILIHRPTPDGTKKAFDELVDWQNQRSYHFMNDSFDDVKTVVEEFGKHYLRDSELDSIVRRIDRRHEPPLITTPEIEEVAQRLRGLAGQIKPDSTVISSEPPGAVQLFVSLTNPSAPAITVENRSDRVAEGVRWSIVLYRISDQAFYSYVTQDMGYIKAHSKSPPYALDLNVRPRAPGPGPIINGDELIGTLGVDCPLCAGSTLIVSFVWGKSGWFCEYQDGKGGHLLPRTQTTEVIDKFIRYLNVISPEERRVSF